MRKNADITILRLDAHGNEIFRLFIDSVSWKQRYREIPNTLGLQPVQEYSIRITPRVYITLDTIQAGDWCIRGAMEPSQTFDDVVNRTTTFQLRAVVDNIEAITVRHWRLVGQGRGSYGG